MPIGIVLPITEKSSQTIGQMDYVSGNSQGFRDVNYGKKLKSVVMCKAAYGAIKGLIFIESPSNNCILVSITNIYNYLKTYFQRLSTRGIHG